MKVEDVGREEEIKETPYKNPIKTKVTPYSTPPETERALQALQEEYLKEDCPKEVKDEYFNTLRMYARSLTLKEIKKKGITLSVERVEEVCTDAVLLIMRQYQKKGWKIVASFAGALYWKIVEALFGCANEEMNLSLNRTFTDDDNAKEMLDLVSNSSEPWSNPSKSYVGPEDAVLKEINGAISEINNLIDQAYDILPYNLFLRFLPWLLLQIRKPRTRNIMDLFSRLFLDNKEENAFDILLLEMRNRVYSYQD